MTTRADLKQNAGFMAARQNDVTGGWVTIYVAAAQGIDVGEGNKYAVVCEEHGTILGTNSLRVARPTMRYPEFCDACMAVARAEAREAAKAEEQARAAAREREEDPLCICGTARSEHALCGCPDGFITPKAWARQRAIIAKEATR